MGQLGEGESSHLVGVGGNNPAVWGWAGVGGG